MRTRKYANIDYFDNFDGKPTSSWLYAYWETLYVPQCQWQPRLAISLHPRHVINQCYDKSPSFSKNAIFFVDPITRETYPDAQVQNYCDRIMNLFQFGIEDENSWFTITITLEHRTRPAVFGTKDVTPVSRRVFGGAADDGFHT